MKNWTMVLPNFVTTVLNCMDYRILCTLVRDLHFTYHSHSDEDKECSTCGRFGKDLSRCSKCKKVTRVSQI